MTLYTLILSLTLIFSSKSDVCIYYSFGASYAPDVKYDFHIHRWVFSFFIHRTIVSLRFHWLLNSLYFFSAGFEVEHFLGYKMYLLFLLVTQIGYDLLS